MIIRVYSDENHVENYIDYKPGELALVKENGEDKIRIIPGQIKKRSVFVDEHKTGTAPKEKVVTVTMPKGKKNHVIEIPMKDDTGFVYLVLTLKKTGEFRNGDVVMPKYELVAVERFAPGKLKSREQISLSDSKKPSDIEKEVLYVYNRHKEEKEEEKHLEKQVPGQIRMSR